MLTIDIESLYDSTLDYCTKNFNVTIKTKDGTPLNISSVDLVGDVIEVTLKNNPYTKKYIREEA
mgnify:CR=1 FL=1